MEEGKKPGDYVVTALAGAELPLRPSLSLPTDLLTEYLDTVNRTPGATPPGCDALSLVEVHLEEELSTADSDGRNHTTAVGVRRGRNGEVEWFAHQEVPGEVQRADPGQNLEWRAEPPR
ncbi:hypothetical protein [Streptoalloteichus hindustanus]|uniref:hypothetical protein n=1 Tax=Streptoalloteichus hindustanus TaxID=2017 RepID=UPI0011610DD4|nr:hypothetical protein [Streptoalloteichus hindustanus]